MTLPYATIPAHEAHSAACQQAYARRARVWTRTDTARWLNDRSAPVLAMLRRRPGTWPAHSRSLGYWIKEHQRDLFSTAHAVLLAARTEDARETLLPQEVLP